MGNKQSLVQQQLQRLAPPPPPKCSGELNEVNHWRQTANNANQVLQQKQAAYDTCSPGGAAARAALSDQNSVCAAKAVRYNQLQRDAINTQKELDDCNPQEAQQRRIREAQMAAGNFIREHSMELGRMYTEFDEHVKNGNKLAKAADQLQSTLWGLEAEIERIRKTDTNFDQLERRERRMFLDGSPQAGVRGIPGVQTADDKVLLSFWVTYGAFFLSALFVAFHIYGGQLATKQKVQIAVLVMIVAYSLAYYAISTFA